MGADGGVVLIPLRYDGAEQEARRLLRPFYGLFDPGFASFAEEATAEWEQTNDTSGFLVGYYGTSVDATLLHLREILDPDAQPCSDPSLTFAELCEDIETRPYATASGGDWNYVGQRSSRQIPRWSTYDAQGRRAFSELERWLIDHVLRHGNRAEALEPIGGMVVAEWADAMRGLVDASRTLSVETWT